MRLAFFSVDTTVLFIRARRMGLVKDRVKTQTHLVAHHLHGKTSRFTVEANSSKIQVIKGGKFHEK